MVKAITYHATTLALPFILAAFALVAGRFSDGASWMWSIMAASLTFAGAAAGIFFVFELVGKRSIDGRLHCIAPRIANDINTGQPSLGIHLQSACDLPLEFEVATIRTELDGIYPSSKPFGLTVFAIPPRGLGFFNDFGINLLGRDVAGKVLKGSILARVLYGGPGKRKYSLDIKREVHLKFSAEGSLESFTWNEVA
jgi:hypothetical protein